MIWFVQGPYLEGLRKNSDRLPRPSSRMSGGAAIRLPTSYLSSVHPTSIANNYVMYRNVLSMLRYKIVIKGCDEVKHIKRLYSATFPGQEKVPFRHLIRTFGKGGDMISFFDGETFVGFAYMFTSGDLTFLVYLAMLPESRGKGYGSQAMDLIRKFKDGNRIFSVMETPGCGFSDPEVCAKRRQFYERNGCTVPGILLRSDEYDFDSIYLGSPISAEEMQDAVERYESVHNAGIF